ncbi:flagellar hook-length control protein FliK [Sediminicurvatus halobius]|uniref:Flagellar hook-length control protein-like C-terminal domain-containing protein n=1 Tax=Sediminicurvatus halobius TaxID=2182432 RepID=A0A2U2N3K5_9GAMM|nr:flagellar hook-length control protein FliK [Spiribacter halobius]PWG63652.1 hypothetical protein DEM34_07165 [Spiribacter halobius]UEX79790.1 flagellar hook-length control protein FliK [Spiribacter halobius]
MMSSNIVQTLAQQPAGRAAPEGNAGGDGFLAELAEGVEKLTGEKVSVEQLRAWLAGDAPDGFPTQALMQGLAEGLGQERAALDAEVLDPEALAGLLAEGEDLPDAARAAGEDGQTDIAGLLGLLALAREGDGRSVGGDQPLGRQLEGVLARLRQGGGEEGLRGALAEAPRGGESEPAADSRAFRQLVEAATAARDAQSSTSRADMPTLQPVRTPVNQPGFSQAVGESVLWMARNEVQQARIQLNPPGLGPLEVSLQLGEERASVHFNAHHAATREALAADMPRLRTMLAEGGFENVDVNVSSQERGTDGRAGTDSDGSQAGGTFRGQAAEGEGGELGVQDIAGHASGRGLVDHYV